jgi:hypothetical protein
MSNQLKHIAVNNYYSGKTFGSASTHNIHLIGQFTKNGVIFNVMPCIYQTFGLG